MEELENINNNLYTLKDWFKQRNLQLSWDKPASKLISWTKEMTMPLEIVVDSKTQTTVKNPKNSRGNL